MQAGKKIYFASDFHLGVPTFEKSLQREKLICKWLDEIKHDAEEIYLVGDVFDFWFEHAHSVPKGFVRLLGKLAELSDNGIRIHFFGGNHDMWMRQYLPRELNANVYYDPISREYNGKKFFIGHGDGLGPGDHKYKFLKKIFTSKICQWLFARLHPNFSFGIANYFSRKSRIATGTTDEKYLGDENEWLYIFCKEHLKKNKVDYFIFGHRHLPIDVNVDSARYVNLGDWLKYNSYAVFDGKDVELKYYSSSRV
jgi:UDP-2,3-diacylglucosamine hydrolase